MIYCKHRIFTTNYIVKYVIGVALFLSGFFTSLYAQITKGDPGNFITTWYTAGEYFITIPTTGSGYNYSFRSVY